MATIEERLQTIEARLNILEDYIINIYEKSKFTADWMRVLKDSVYLREEEDDVK